MARLLPPLPLTSACVRLTITTLLFLISPLAVGGQPVQVPTNTPGLTIHYADTVIVCQNPSLGPESLRSHPSSLLVLGRYCACLILGAILVHTPWGRHVLQSLEDRPGRMCPLPRRSAGRNYPVSCSAPTTEGADSALSSSDADHNTGDGRTHSPNERGRRSAAATTFDNEPSSHPSELSRAAWASLVEEDRHGLNDTNGLLKPKAPEYPLPRVMSAPVLASPSPPFELLSPVPGPRRSSAYSTSKQTRTIPTPRPLRSNVSRIRPRYDSLPHDSDYGHTLPGSTKAAPLKMTLYASSKDPDLSSATHCFMLFIAVNTDGKDFERDLCFFQKMIEQPTRGPTSIYFESLSGHYATHNNIKAKLESIYLRAGRISNDPLVLVFLTGHGDKDNRMRLLNNEVLTEKDLCGWISDIRTRTSLPNVPSVRIVLDICRQNKDIPNTSCHVLEFIWSCSLGQRAYALEFDLPNLPSSCFLLAFFLASYDISNSGPPTFKEAFKSRMEQLYQLREYSHHYWHTESEVGKCDQCPEETGRCDPPEPQDPEGEQAGWDALADLAILIRAKYPECVHNIVETMTGQIEMYKIPEAERSTPSSSGLLAAYKVKIAPLLAFWFATRT